MRARRQFLRQVIAEDGTEKEERPDPFVQVLAGPSEPVQPLARLKKVIGGRSPAKCVQGAVSDLGIGACDDLYQIVGHWLASFPKAIRVWLDLGQVKPR